MFIWKLVHVASTSSWTTISTHSPCGIYKILIFQGWIKTGSLGKLKKNTIGNFQHHNTLSAYEVKDETSTNSTYVSLVFYCMVRSSKNTCQKLIICLFFRSDSFEGFCTKIPMDL
jgi:hypothetical protein